MKYFKDQNSKVWAFEDDGSQDHLIKENMVAITESEKEHLIQPSEEQLIANKRMHIKVRLAEIDRESVRPLRAVNAGTASQFDTTKLAELDAEAETLRDELATL
jgi:hypothetical protein